MLENIKMVIGAFLILGLLFLLVTRIRKRQAKESKKRALEKEQEQQKRKIRNTQMKIMYQRKGDVTGELIDYSIYIMNIRERLFIIVISGAVSGLIGYVFYEKTPIVIGFSLLGLLAPIFYKKVLLEKRKNVLNIQFKEAVQSLSASLAAGRSAESSFQEVAYDLKLLYPNPDTYILKEFDIINRRVENGETLERAIEDFAHRSDVEDILNFSDVFITCKRTGGSLVEVMKRTAEIIGDKIEVQQDLKVLVSQKKFESQILNMMPLGMVFLLKTTGGDYLNPLYDWSGAGPIIMTVGLVLFIISFLLGQKIMNIKM